MLRVFIGSDFLGAGTWPVPEVGPNTTGIPATATTATITSQTFTNTSYRGALIYVNVGTPAANQGLTLNVQARDPLSNTFTTFFTPPTITAAGIYQFMIYPGGVATTGVAGPEPQDGKSVGLVYVAVVGPAQRRVDELRLDGGRAAVRAGAVSHALDTLVALLRSPTANSSAS